MKVIHCLPLFLLGCCIFAYDDENPGQKIFEEAKCMRCHEVASVGIETTSKKDPSEVTDLSNAGNDFASAEELAAFLKKESVRNDKKHRIGFRGEESDLEILITWLLSLKSE